MPFLILAWYSNPSADDYSFAYGVMTRGFLESQESFYTTWTGRYVSTFLISVHPLLLNSLFLYKLVSFIFVGATIHVSYIFVSRFFTFEKRSIRLWIALTIAYISLNGFPSLIQGVYWMPGSITYQLGNILAIYFVGFAFRVISGRLKPTFTTQVLAFIMVVASCGLSETGMIVMLVLSFSALLFDAWKNKRLAISFVIFSLGAIGSSLVVIMAPGNDGRGNLSAESDKAGRILRAFESSFGGTLDMITGWLAMPEIWILSIMLFLAVITFKLHSRIQVKRIWPLLIYLIWGFGILWATLLPSYYVLAGYPPARTMNVSYWAFLFLWVGLVLLMASRFQEIKPQLKLKRPVLWFSLSFLAFFVALEKSDNFYIATGDIVSGRAHRFNQQYMDRENLMQSCEGEICTVPSFTSHPRSVFNEDLAPNSFEGFNTHYAYLLGKRGVEVAYSEAERYFKILMDMEKDNPLELENWHTVTEEAARSGKASSKVSNDTPYGVLFRKRFNSLGIDNYFTISHSEISVYAKCTEHTASAQIIFAITNPGQSITHLWKAYPIDCSFTEPGEWFETRLRIPIDKRLIGRKNMIIMYIGYPTGEIFIDDMQMLIY